MGFDREPWEQIATYGMRQYIAGPPLFYSSTRGDAVPCSKRKSKIDVVDIRESWIAVHEDPLCRMRHLTLETTAPRPIDYWDAFSKPIFKLIKDQKYVRKFNINLDIQEHMPKRKKMCREDKERDAHVDMKDYATRQPHTLTMTDSEFLEDGKAVPIPWQKLMSARHLRIVVYEYFKQKFCEDMIGIENVELVLNYDPRGSFSITHDSCVQSVFPLTLGEGDTMCWNYANADDTNYVISMDSDHIRIGLKAVRDRLTKFPCVLSGSGGRHLMLTEAVKRMGKASLQHMLDFMPLLGTDFMYKHFPDRTPTRKIYASLWDYRGRDLQDREVFMDFYRNTVSSDELAERCYDMYRWNVAYWDSEGVVDLDRSTANPTNPALILPPIRDKDAITVPEKPVKKSERNGKRKKTAPETSGKKMKTDQKHV